MQIERILNKEHQLGSALSHSVAQSRRADFAMCLAMLSPNALDFSQFHLPHGEPEVLDKSEEALKKQLQIGPEQPLAPEKFDMLIGQHNAHILQTSGLTDIKLNHLLNPEPLSARDDKHYIDLLVLDNCEPTVQAKIIAKREEKLAAAKPDIDAAGFYDQLASGEMQSALSISA